MMLSDIVPFSLRMHERLTNFVRPESGPHSESREAAGRFISLVLLASSLFPLFVLQFSYSGFPLASAMMAVTGTIMISSVWVYRVTGRLWIARDLFLGALYLFLTWETFYFNSVYSPGMIWYAAMPVASVLLGSYRAGTIWLALNCVSAVASGVLISETGNHEYLIGGYELLYVVSVVCLSIAIFIFILMIDAARARAYRGLRQANEAIRTKAETDDLTGLFNRRAFQETLSSRCTMLLDCDSVAVLILDLDGFKEVNDTHGHDAGDELIKNVARRLQDLGHKRNATVARLGGDEFAVLLWGVDAGREARTLADEALDFVRMPLRINGRTCSVGVSIGIAVTDKEVSAAELLRRADVAMYVAKAKGKNRRKTYSASMDCVRAKRAKQAEELEEVLVNEGMEVHYQPIVDSKGRQIIGVEALARWRNIDGEFVPPDEFIPVAEEAGLIDRLGMQVLEKACEAAKAWPSLKLSVNLSPAQFRSPTLVADIRAVLKRTGFPAGRLELEVTEGYLIERPDLAQPILTTLQSLGIRIALDDFGTGYSSIGYLREYRFDRLKLDRTLVHGVAHDPTARAIIQAAILLAQSLTMDVTAEGIESGDEARLLQLAGCDHLQGYFFGKPRAAGSITKMVSDFERREKAA